MFKKFMIVLSFLWLVAMPIAGYKGLLSNHMLPAYFWLTFMIAKSFNEDVDLLFGEK